MVLHQLSGDMEITFQIRFCAYRIIISVETLVKTATHRRCGKVLTNIPAEMDKSSSTKEAISEYWNSDFQFSGSAISSHKNIQNSIESTKTIYYHCIRLSFLRPHITKRSEGKIQWANAKNFIFCFCLSHIQKKNGVFTGCWRILFYFYAKKAIRLHF